MSGDGVPGEEPPRRSVADDPRWAEEPVEPPPGDRALRMGPTLGPRPGAPDPNARRPRYGWIVGVVALVALAWITLNTLRTDGPGSTGLSAGSTLPPFAAPLATSDLTGDANVAREPDQGAAGAIPACDVDDPRALNICTLADRGPVVLAFVTAGSDRCTRELDAMERVSGRFRDVGFAAVTIKGDREELAKLVRERRWTFPVAQDADGAVANLYGIAVCPTVVLAYRGGEVMETAVGDEVSTPAELAAKVQRLRTGPDAAPARSGGTTSGAAGGGAAGTYEAGRVPEDVDPSDAAAR